jgi:hypothetical protein
MLKNLYFFTLCFLIYTSRGRGINSTHGEGEEGIQKLMRHPVGKRPVARTKSRREDNIKIYLR